MKENARVCVSVPDSFSIKSSTSVHTAAIGRISLFFFFSFEKTYRLGMVRSKARPLIKKISLGYN